MTGKHIELFLVEGVPGGITTAEIAGWTGHVLAGPRSDLGEVLERPEGSATGRTSACHFQCAMNMASG